MEKEEKYSEKTRVFKVFKELIPYAVIILVVVLIRTFIATPVIVDGDSMLPNLKNNQVMILYKLPL